jgi:hypothetical protein
MHFKNQYKLRKVDEDKRMVYGPAMIPDLPIYRMDEKGNEFFIKFPKDVVREMAHRFLMKNNHQNTTVDHEKKLSNTIVVESWIKEGESDKSISLGLGELPDGTWLTGSKVNDDDVWSRVKSGELTGYSIEVDLERVLVGSDPVDELVKEMEQIINSI